MKTVFTLLTLALSLTMVKAQTALNFDDVDDHIIVPHDPLLDFYENFTIEAWVKVTGGGYHTVVSSDELDGSGHRGIWFGVTNSGYAGIQLFNHTFSFSTVQGTTVVNDGNWHHIAAGVNGATTFVVVDGVLEASGASYPRVFSERDLDIGTDQEGNYLNGNIDDIRIWLRAVPVEEINTYKDSCLTGGEENILDSLVALYKFDEGSGTITNDATYYEFNGTLYNMDDSDWVEGKVCAEVIDPSAIDEGKELQDVTVFYNEVKNQVMVNLIDLNDVNIKLYNMNGTIIHEANNINTSTYNFDLNAERGMYVAIIESNGQSGHFKIIKTN